MNTDKEKARKLVMEIAKLSEQYNLPIFAVTEGASITRNNGSAAVRNARLAQIEWEKANGEDPDEDWMPSKNLISVRKHSIQYPLEKEYRQGIYLASRMKSDKAERTVDSLTEAIRMYNNNNEIDIDTPIEIRSKYEMNKRAYEASVSRVLSKQAGAADMWNDFKNHIKENKRHYISGGIGALAGAGLGAGIFGSIHPKSPGAWIGGALGGAGVGAGLGAGGSILWDIIKQRRFQKQKDEHDDIENTALLTTDAGRQMYSDMREAGANPELAFTEASNYEDATEDPVAREGRILTDAYNKIYSLPENYSTYAEDLMVTGLSPEDALDAAQALYNAAQALYNEDTGIAAEDEVALIGGGNPPMQDKPFVSGRGPADLPVAKATPMAKAQPVGTARIESTVSDGFDAEAEQEFRLTNAAQIYEYVNARRSGAGKEEAFQEARRWSKAPTWAPVSPALRTVLNANGIDPVGSPPFAKPRPALGSGIPSYLRYNPTAEGVRMRLMNDPAYQMQMAWDKPTTTKGTEYLRRK